LPCGRWRGALNTAEMNVAGCGEPLRAGAVRKAPLHLNPVSRRNPAPSPGSRPSSRLAANPSRRSSTATWVVGRRIAAPSSPGPPSNEQPRPGDRDPRAESYSACSAWMSRAQVARTLRSRAARPQWWSARRPGRGGCIARRKLKFLGAPTSSRCRARLSASKRLRQAAPLRCPATWPGPKPWSSFLARAPFRMSGNKKRRLLLP